MGASSGIYSSYRESNGKGFALFFTGVIGPVIASVPGLACIPRRDVPHDGQFVLCSAISLPHCAHTIMSRFFPVLYGTPLHCSISMYVSQCIMHHFALSSFAHYRRFVWYLFAPSGLFAMTR